MSCKLDAMFVCFSLTIAAADWLVCGANSSGIVQQAAANVMTDSGQKSQWTNRHTTAAFYPHICADDLWHCSIYNIDIKTS